MVISWPAPAETAPGRDTEATLVVAMIAGRVEISALLALAAVTASRRR